MTTVLSSLIARCDWDGVYQRLQSSPKESSIPIPTSLKGTVYPLHQAICAKGKTIPHEVLILLLAQFPNALDLDVFIGASGNPQLSRRSMEHLLDCSSTVINQKFRNNAQRFTSMAVKRKNGHIVKLLIERFPSVLDSGMILGLACMYGTANMVKNILAAGHHRNVGKAGGLYLKSRNREDALDIAIKLYNEKDEERRNILIVCLQYANAEKMGTGLPCPNYPVVLAAVGLVPERILKSFLKLYTNKITNTTSRGRHAIMKAIQMSSRENQRDELPTMFNSIVLVNACSNGRVDEVQQMLELPSKNLSNEKIQSNFLEKKSNINALEVALDLFDQNDDTSCDILRLCVQYANASILGKKFPLSDYPANLSDYPTLLAAVGLIPLKVAVRLGMKYDREMKKMGTVGKLAVKKILKLAEEKQYYANLLDPRCQYRLSFKTSRAKLKRALTLESIPSETQLEYQEENTNKIARKSRIALPCGQRNI